MKVPAGGKVFVNAKLNRFRTDVPFKTRVKTTLGDGTTYEGVVEGTWRNVDYVTGDITLSPG